MNAPLIFSGKFGQFISNRGGLTPNRNVLEFNGYRNYLTGQFQDFVIANDVTTGTGPRTTNGSKWRQSASSLISLETTNPLTPTQSMKATLTGIDNTQFAESPLFTLDRADINSNIFVQFQTEPSGTFAVNDMDIIAVNYNSSGSFTGYIPIVPKSGTKSTGFSTQNSAQIAASLALFQGYFPATGIKADQYSILIRSNNAAARSVVFGDFFVGIQDPISTTNIIGRGNNAVAPSGYIGEKISDLTQTGTAAGSAGAYAQIRTITLTPGCWAISATAILFRNGATLDVSGNWLMNICTTSASNTGTVFGYSETVMPQGLLITGSILSSAHLSGVVVNISANTNYYMNCSVTYSAAVPQWYGTITGIRIA